MIVNKQVDKQSFGYQLGIRNSKKDCYYLVFMGYILKLAFMIAGTFGMIKSKNNIPFAILFFLISFIYLKVVFYRKTFSIQSISLFYNDLNNTLYDMPSPPYALKSKTLFYFTIILVVLSSPLLFLLIYDGLMNYITAPFGLIILLTIYNYAIVVIIFIVNSFIETSAN